MLLQDSLDRNVRAYPQKTALLFYDRSYTYKEIGEKANRFTNFMMDLGIKKGDRVALLAKNCPEYLINLFGIVQAGAVLVPLNFRLKAQEAEYIISQSDTKYFIFGREFLELVQKLKSQLTKVEYFIMMGDGEMSDEILSYAKLISDASSKKPNIEIDERDVAIQMYTSGTTGKPKGALLTHRNMFMSSYLSVLSMQITSSGRALLVAPLFHIAAVASAVGTVLAGGTNVISDKFDPAEVLKLFEKEKITHSFFSPTMLRMLLKVPGVENYDYSSLHTISFGGAPITYDILLEVYRVFRCNLLQGMGQTEAAAFLVGMDQEEYREIAANPALQHRLKAVGKEWPALHMRIVDDNDNDVPIGEAGEIIIKGDNTMLGYYKMPKETEKTLRGGWLHTGDLGRLDQDGYVYLVDRKKDMIISGGENIYCLEIENLIGQMPQVQEVAVVGKPDEKWGEIPKAFVELVPGSELTEEEVIAFCRENLAGYKCPKEVVFVEEFPWNSAGKVIKTELKKII